MSPLALVPTGVKAVQPGLVGAELANKPIRRKFQRLRNRLILLGPRGKGGSLGPWQ
jgi:hypothetical protein